MNNFFKNAIINSLNQQVNNPNLALSFSQVIIINIIFSILQFIKQYILLMQIKNIISLQHQGYQSQGVQLGLGAFGVVRLYQKRNVQYAIKIIQSQSSNEAYQSKEIQISQILIKQNHQNIVKVYAIMKNQISKQIYIVMEYVADKDMYNTKINWKVEEKYQFLLGILRGLVFLHQHQITHRDLKPSNVLIKKINGKYVPKLCDFGISKLLKKKQLMWTVVGTQLYMAPEIQIEQGYDIKIDVWAFGVIAYELLTNQNPFKSINYKNKLQIGKKLPMLKRIFNKIFITKSSRSTSQELLEQMKKPLTNLQIKQIKQYSTRQQYRKQPQSQIIVANEQQRKIKKILVRKIGKDLNNNSNNTIQQEVNIRQNYPINNFIPNEITNRTEQGNRNQSIKQQIRPNIYIQQINNLKRQLQKTELELVDYKVELSQFKKVLNDSKNQNSNLRKEIERLEQTERIIKRQKQQLSLKTKLAIQSQKSINESYETALKSFTNKQKQLKKHLIQKCNMIKKSQETIEKIKESYKRFISNNIQQLKGISQNIPPNNGQDEDILERQWKQKIKRALRQLKNQNKKLQFERNNIQEKLNKQKIDNLSKENQKLKENISNVRDDLTSLQRKQNDIIKKYNNKIQLNHLQGQQLFQRYSLQQIFDAQAQQIKNLKNVNKGLQNQINRFKRQILSQKNAQENYRANKQYQLHEKSQKLAFLEKQKQQMETLVNHLKQQNEQLKNILYNRNSQYRIIQKQLQENNQKMLQLNDERDRLKQSIENNNNRNNYVNREIINKQINNQDVQKLKQQINELQYQNSCLKTELSSKRSQKSKQQKKVSQIVSQNIMGENAYNLKIAQNSNKLKKYLNKIDQDEKQLTLKNKELNKKQQQCQNQLKQINNLIQTKSKLQLQNKQLSNKCQTSKQSQNSLQKYILENNELRAKLKQQLKKKQQQYEVSQYQRENYSQISMQEDKNLYPLNKNQSQISAKQETQQSHYNYRFQ